MLTKVVGKFLQNKALQTKHNGLIHATSEYLIMFIVGSFDQYISWQ